MFELFERGGIMMYPLLFASIIAVVYVIERWVSLLRRKIIIPEVVSVVENFSSLKDIDLARNVCSKHNGPLPNLLSMVLDNPDVPLEEMREVLQDQGRQEIRTLQKGLPILETTAAIAPLLGLLGTVIGMVQVFSVIQDQGVGQTAALSGGISQALLTTVAGLFIGIPVLIAFNYFSSKADNLILDIEEQANKLVLKMNKAREAK